MSTRSRYTSGVNSLLDRIRKTTDRAAQSGSLISLPTERTVVEDRGIAFIVHTTDLQTSKTRAKTNQIEKSFNPFLPPDPDLIIGDLTSDHVSVLNKYNVLDHHLLIVTRIFEAQETLLNVGDFEALAACMDEIDGLGFYNGGVTAGASQAHKHLQLIPLPLGDGPLPTPMDSVIDPSAEVGRLSRVPLLPFDHALIRLDGNGIDSHRAKELHEFYRRACRAVNVHDETQPYNLLLTRRWMLVVPRSREHWRGVSINALGFAGSLLVRSPTELEQLKLIGPLAVLKSVVDEELHG